jgi:hypothetical protein
MALPMFAAIGAGFMVGAALSGASQITDLERVNLKGITAVRVSVVGIDDDALKCNLKKDALSLAAGRALLDGGIKLEDTAPVTAEVRVLVLPMTGGVCVGYIETRMETQVFTSLRFQMTGEEASAFMSGKAQPATVVFARLWSAGDLLTGPPSAFGDEANGSVRERVGAFVTRVKLANPK